jgi:hypothetical protein
MAHHKSDFQRKCTLFGDAMIALPRIRAAFYRNAFLQKLPNRCPDLGEKSRRTSEQHRNMA